MESRFVPYVARLLFIVGKRRLRQLLARNPAGSRDIYPDTDQPILPYALPFRLDD